MVVARAGGEGPHQRCGAGRGRSCPHQWRARKGAGTRREGWRRADDRTRSQRADPEGGRICGAAGRCGGGARALRRFAGTARVTIYIEIDSAYMGIDSAWFRTARKRLLEVPSFLAAAEFLGYATHLKLVRFGVLDDLRRH